MPLVIDFQEGFEDDTVVITLDGREVFRKAGVRTRYQIGRAESVTLDPAAGQHRVTVSLPGKGLESGITLDLPAAAFLGVSLGAGGLVLTPSSEPFRYL